MRIKHIAILLVAILGGSLSVCHAAKPAKHMVMIGVDGLAAHDFPDRAHDIPNLSRLMRDGSYTLHKRSVYPTASAINWSSIFNGACTEMHGYIKNEYKPQLPQMASNERGVYPTIFTAIRQQMPGAVTGLTCDWDLIKHITDSATIDNITYIRQPSRDPLPVAETAKDFIINQKPTFMAFTLGSTDHAGHVNGWYTPEYWDMVARVDQTIGQIEQWYRDAGIYDQTIFVVTADHGGINHGHGARSYEEMESPFIVCGPGIRKGYEMKEEMVQFDTPSTLLALLGLSQPRCWRGQAKTEILDK